MCVESQRAFVRASRLVEAAQVGQRVGEQDQRVGAEAARPFDGAGVLGDGADAVAAVRLHGAQRDVRQRDGVGGRMAEEALRHLLGLVHALLGQ